MEIEHTHTHQQKEKRNNNSKATNPIRIPMSTHAKSFTQKKNYNSFTNHMECIGISCRWHEIVLSEFRNVEHKITDDLDLIIEMHMHKTHKLEISLIAMQYHTQML